MSDFRSDNREIIDQVIRSLDRLIEKLNDGSLPTLSDKEEAISVLEKYTDLVELYESKTQCAFTKVHNRSYEEFDPVLVKGELRKIRSYLTVLARIAREKIIDTSDDSVRTDITKKLIDTGYCEEIEYDNKTYYILTQKSEKVFRDHDLYVDIRESTPELIIPVSMIHESNDWNGLYMKRLVLLHQYYMINRDKQPHIIFSLQGESMDMIFGCGLDNAEGVEYSFAGLFDDTMVDQIKRIRAISQSGLIDYMVICVRNEMEKDHLIKAGLNNEEIPQLGFCIVN